MAETPTPIAEIDHGPGKLEQFLDNHQKKLIIAAILLALGVVGYVVWSGLEEAKQNEAGSALVKADETADYQGVIKKYPDSKAAASAMPLLADMQWQDSQPDSIQTLQDFIAQHPEHPATHTATVSLGIKLLEQGKTEEAVEKLSEIAESHSDSYIAPLASITLGDIAKSKKAIAEAKSWYEKAKGSNENRNAFSDMADARLAIVSAEPPVKIKPAPPKLPTPPTGEDTPAPTIKPDAGTEPLPAPKLTVPDASEKNSEPEKPEQPEKGSEPTAP